MKSSFTNLDRPCTAASGLAVYNFKNKQCGEALNEKKTLLKVFQFTDLHDPHEVDFQNYEVSS